MAGRSSRKGKDNDKMTRKMIARPPTPQLPPALLLMTGQPRSSQSSSAPPLRTHAQVPMPECNMQLRCSKLPCACRKYMCNERVRCVGACVFR